MLKERTILGGTFILAVTLWIFQSLHWNSLLDGDAALYSLMSTEVLNGQHYLYTVGQSHGGTPLVYLRALVFQLLGVSHFWGFFINGLFAAFAGVLWARFAYRIAGPVAAAATGLLTAVASEIFVQYSLTDYYVLSLVAGGLMLNAALTLSKRDKLSPAAYFGVGLLTGFSFYVCRFTALYAFAALVFFLQLSPRTRLAAFAPRFSEILRLRGIKGVLNKILLVAAGTGALLFVLAFFSGDRFLGVNAEATLKLEAKLIAALWLLHRWPLLLKTPIPPLCFMAGAALGLLPDFIFRALNPEQIDRTTGLVRWQDFAPLIGQVPFNIGSNFSRAAPFSFGLAGAAAAAGILVLGFIGKDGRLKRYLKIALIAGVLPALASWVLIHTYMYFKVQYFYPAYLPLYLSLGLALASTRLKVPATLLLAVVISAGASDLYANFTKPNHRASSGILETMQAWGIDVGTGDYDSTYDIMWTYRKAITLEPLHAGRFQQYRTARDAAAQLAYVYRAGDPVPEEKRAYTVLKSAPLSNGYTLELLKRN